MSRARAQFALDLGRRQALRRDDFLVAPCNSDAVAWLDRWPRWPGRGLVVHGPAGCGKTHLAHVFRARSGARIARASEVAASDAYARPADLVVEDVDSGADARALLHAYNAAVERGGSLLMTSRRPPRTWDADLPDLRSRVNALGSVAVGLPDDALLAAVLAKQLADRQLRVGNAVVTYLVRHMERSFRAARDIVEALDERSLADRREITVPLARRMLAHDRNPEGG